MNHNFILEILSLTMLQSVLMIDNVIFISVLTENLSDKTRFKARLIGLMASLCMNTILILSAGYIIEYSEVEIFSVASKYKFDLHHSLMLFGGLFLIWKTVREFRHRLDFNAQINSKTKKAEDLASTVIAMIGVDLVFSVDSTLTAIGMSESRTIQIASVLIAVCLMFLFFNVINKMTGKYPSLKTLALCFLLLIGFNLVMEGFGKDLEKSLTYFAMAFALFAEFLDIWFTNRAIKLKKKAEEIEASKAITKTA